MKNTALLPEGFRHELPAIGYLRLNRVYVLGNGLLLDENRKRIRSPYLPYTFLNSEKGVKLSAGPVKKTSKFTFVTQDLSLKRVTEPVALLTQPGDRIFGHWLVDLLPRLAITRNIHQPLRYIVKNEVLNGNAIKDIESIFNIFDFDRKKALGLRPVTNAYFCEELIVPSVVRYGQQIHSFVNSLYFPLRNQMNLVDYLDAKKVYLSRRKWTPSGQHRVLINALELEQYYQDRGYRIVYPEQLSFDQKLNLVRNAVEVVGEKGSALHLSLFSNKIKKMTVFLNPDEESAGLPLLQQEICRIQAIDCHYVYGRALESNHGYEISIDDLIFHNL